MGNQDKDIELFRDFLLACLCFINLFVHVELKMVVHHNMGFLSPGINFLHSLVSKFCIWFENCFPLPQLGDVRMSGTASSDSNDQTCDPVGNEETDEHVELVQFPSVPTVPPRANNCSNGKQQIPNILWI